MANPAGLKNFVDVASTSLTDNISTFSNYGAPPIWVGAPGEAIMTSYPAASYAAGWGTSFSTPLVSGTAALLANSNRLVNQSSAASALSHAQPIGTSLIGYGRLNTYDAVQAIRNQFIF